MQDMKLYFVRHGLTEDHESGIHQAADSLLNKEGREQAQTTAKRLKSKDIDVVFTSPFSRAKETAEIISKELNKKIEIRDELKEVEWPSEIIGLHFKDPGSKKVRMEISKNFSDPTYKYSDEESFNEIKKRAEKFLLHLLRHHSKQNVLCVSHGLIQKVFVGLILFEELFDVEMFYKFKKNSWMDTGGITEIDHTEKYGWSLQTWNDRTHL